MGKSKLKIVFMGTPEFAIPSLDILIQNGYEVAGVVTALDKESGRGRKIRYSPIKEYAITNNLLLLQPSNLKDEVFLSELKSLQANLQIVVAFRMLPEAVWAMPKYGTFNLHASLLPQYRGAAPINHAIINGEKKTGLTTFFIDKEIDTGNIILQDSVEIGDEENFGQLHDRMKIQGAELVLKTVEKINENDINAKLQNNFLTKCAVLKSAPKLTKEYCRIDWTNPLDDIQNFIRGLSPFPGAHTILKFDNTKTIPAKIFKSKKEYASHGQSRGGIVTDLKTFLKITVDGGYLHLLVIQVAGKRKMSIEEFLRGNRLPDEAMFY